MTVDILLIFFGLAITVLLLFAAAFFSGAETALISLNRMKLKSMSDAGFRNARILNELMSEPEMVVLSMLCGLDLAVVLGTAMTGWSITRVMGEGKEVTALILTTLILSPLFIVFGELIPRTVFRQRADKLPMKYARLIRAFHTQFYYAVLHASWFASRLKRLLHKWSRKEDALFMTKEEIMLLIKMSESDGVIKKTEGRMISKVFMFNKLVAGDIMTPRKDIVALPINTSLEEVVAKAAARGFSRIPIYEETIDNIKGFIYVLDLVRQDYRGKSTKDIIRKTIFVPETKKISVLLREMQAQKLHMAIVVDEYGGTAGLVTMEDLIEEIVGEIHDEHDADEPDFIRIDENTFLVNAMMDLEDAASELKLELDPVQDIHTLGGYLINLFGHVPVSKEEIVHKGMKFIVEKAEKQRIKKIRVVKLKDDFQERKNGRKE